MFEVYALDIMLDMQPGGDAFETRANVMKAMQGPPAAGWLVASTTPARVRINASAMGFKRIVSRALVRPRLSSAG